MLAGLWHHSFVGSDDQQSHIDATRTHQHVFDETLVSGHVNDAYLVSRR